jgi:hypothetical protein
MLTFMRAFGKKDYRYLSKLTCSVTVSCVKTISSCHITIEGVNRIFLHLCHVLQQYVYIKKSCDQFLYVYRKALANTHAAMGQLM